MAFWKSGPVSSSQWVEKVWPGAQNAAPSKMNVSRISRLNVGDDVDLDPRIAGDAAGRGNGGAYRRFFAEAPLELCVHLLVVHHVVEIDIALQDFVHGGTDALELFLDGIE